MAKSATGIIIGDDADNRIQSSISMPVWKEKSPTGMYSLFEKMDRGGIISYANDTHCATVAKHRRIDGSFTEVGTRIIASTIKRIGEFRGRDAGMRTGFCNRLKRFDDDINAIRCSLG